MPEEEKVEVEAEVKPVPKKKTAKKTVRKKRDNDYKKPQGVSKPEELPTPLPKTLDVTNIEDAKAKINDIKVVGNGDLFTLLSKASSESQGWMKSTKAMKVGVKGCLVQVTTQQKNLDGTYSVAEALTYVPGANIAEDENGGKKLV